MIALAAALALARSADPVPAQALWRSGNLGVWAVSCAHDPEPGPDCTTLEARRGASRTRLGTGYLPARPGGVKILWKRTAGRQGPDVVAFGTGGGSGACVDIFAVAFSASATRTQKLSACHDDLVTVQTRGGLPVLDIVFDFSFFRGGSHASAAKVPVPVRWSGGRFELDLPEIEARRFGAEDDALRRSAVSASLSQAVDEKGEVRGDDLQPAVQALAGLMLYGRADRAHRLLIELWPQVADADVKYAPARGRDAFWAELCAYVVRNSLWSGLDARRLPHAELIEAGAKTGRPR